MKALIIYSSKTGTTKKCASLLAANLGAENCTLCSIDEGAPEIAGYDCVVLGSYIRMGMIDKKLAAFIKTNMEALKNTKFAIFLCGCISEKISEAITKNFSDDILERALCVEYFGGEMLPEKQKGIDKIVVNSLMKITKNDPSFSVINSVNTESIQNFAKEISC